MNPFRSPFSFGDQMYGLNSNSGQLPSGPYGQQMGDPSVWAMMQRAWAQPQLPPMGAPQYGVGQRPPMPSRMDVQQQYGSQFQGNPGAVQGMQGAMMGRPGMDQRLQAQQQYGTPFAGDLQRVQAMQSALPGMTSTPYQMRRWQGGLLGGFTD